MASSDAPSLVVIRAKVKRARVGDIDRNKGDARVKELGGNLGCYVYVDL